ncbi:UDP-N-acetylglucosamine--N-acetylmuramyl-(pentapeptide) pyrophosphoryl-undecaprenol N-acetylglucosamine transferase, partial [Pseudoalteromonas sp. S3776]
ALKVIRSCKPVCVLGMGGFVTGPGGVAARLAGIPLVIHEQNAIAGFTNKILSRIARKVLLAFPDAFGSVNGSGKFILTGNPVRTDIADLGRPAELTGRALK